MTTLVAISRRQLLQYVALVALSLIVGAALATVLTGHSLEQALLAKEKLQNEVARLQEELKQLQATLKERRRYVVRSVTVQTGLSNERLRLKVERELHRFLSGLVGKEVSRVDPGLVSRILEGRVLRIDKTDYQVEVIQILIWEQVTVNVKVQPLT